VEPLGAPPKRAFGTAPRGAGLGAPQEALAKRALNILTGRRLGF